MQITAELKHRSQFAHDIYGNLQYQNHQWGSKWNGMLASSLRIVGLEEGTNPLIWVQFFENNYKTRVSETSGNLEGSLEVNEHFFHKFKDTLEQYYALESMSVDEKEAYYLQAWLLLGLMSGIKYAEARELQDKTAAIQIKRDLASYGNFLTDYSEPQHVDHMMDKRIRLLDEMVHNKYLCNELNHALSLDILRQCLNGNVEINQKNG